LLQIGLLQIGGRFYGGIGFSAAPAEKTSGDTDVRCARVDIEAIRVALDFSE